MRSLLRCLLFFFELELVFSMISNMVAIAPSRSSKILLNTASRRLRTTWMKSSKSSESTPLPVIAKVSSKRKVALTLSYVGSNYHGLQIDVNNAVPTVEAEVERVLHELGCIKPSNFGDLTKIQWSRSSRTDKYVHSARLVISAKLEIPAIWTNDVDSTIDFLADKCNALLPADIRVLSACKVNQGFRAREACTWREYEYVMPKSFLTSGLPSLEDANLTSEEVEERMLERERSVTALFAKNLGRLEGTNSFHNFHRLSAKNVKKKIFTGDDDSTNDRNKETKSKAAIGSSNSTSLDIAISDRAGEEGDPEAAFSASIMNKPGDLIDPVASVDTKTETVTETVMQMPVDAASSYGQDAAHVSSNFFSTDGDYFRTFFDEWVPILREQNELTRGIIFACEIIEEDGTSSAKDGFLRLRVRGQSFLLHQIRLMIAASALIARGTLPEIAMEMALVAPFFINLPLAPAEGLIVVNAGFERNSNGKAMSLYSETAGVADNQSVNLMTKEEYDFSESFKNDSIYIRIMEDWKKDNNKLVHSWVTSSERYRAPSHVINIWKETVVGYQAAAVEEKAAKRAKETTRLLKNIDLFTKDYLESGEDYTVGDWTAIPQWIKDDRVANAKKGRIPKFKEEPISHGKFLPNGLSLGLINRFRVMPGEDVIGVQRGLATLLVTRKLDHSLSVEGLLEYVARNGGFYEFLRNVYKHPMIV